MGMKIPTVILVVTWKKKKHSIADTEYTCFNKQIIYQWNHVLNHDIRTDVENGIQHLNTFHNIDFVTLEAHFPL
jgi:hypothetical protein